MAPRLPTEICLAVELPHQPVELRVSYGPALCRSVRGKQHLLAVYSTLFE